MNNIEVTDLFGSVEHINDAIINLLPEEPAYTLMIESDGYASNVMLGTELLWSSENDERGYVDEDECEYEPLQDFLIRKAIEHLAKSDKVIGAIRELQ